MDFLIDTPPATISGALHTGHIFSYTQGSMISRYQAYMGKDVLFPFCFDNNGIPTGKLAANKNIKGTENIIAFSQERGAEYKEVFNTCGINYSDDTYHTYSDLAIDICYKAFEYLKETGIAYKATTEYLWSDKLRTSISQSELDENGLIERTGEEPIIKTGEGWFIDIKSHLPAIKAMSDTIDWKPLKYKKRMDDWCDAIAYDWSISRERNFGIPMPGEDRFTFDTWFVSALTPQIAWSSRQGFNDMFNTPIFDMRFQSHDIIRTWSFYTIAMSYFLSKQIPWKTLMITGHTLDGSGNKQSKSNGGATLPLPLIERYGIAGIRYWSFSSALGTDTQIDEPKMKMGWRILNKFENANKFINIQIANGWIGEKEEYFTAYLYEKTKILAHLEAYELDKANDALYDFFWNTFCSKWIEESKKESCVLTLKQIADDLAGLITLFYKG